MSDWKKAQETIFTKWVNSYLKGHLVSNKNRVRDLATDLQDGIILAELLENVAKDKFHYMKEDRQLKFKSQKLENLGASFKFMNGAEIKLVNIGPEDIYNGNLKLILGLIWTLIRRYQIRSTGRAISTKNAMLAWINTQIPDQHIMNFTTDWNSGIAICALVDRIRPGLIPHIDALNPSDKIRNCTLGMGLAADKLDIPKIMDPEDLSHPDVDDVSVMTYISYFCGPANAHLLKWVQHTIPHRKIQNFTTDWNNGTNLAHLLEALNPGGFPDCNKLDPNNALDNLTKCIKAAEEQLGIKPVLTASQMADPSVDELNIVTYLSRFQNAKPLPQPAAISCSGEGLRKAIVGMVAVFEIDTSKGGLGDLEVEIHCEGKPLKGDISPNFGDEKVFTVKYTPESAGTVTIVVKWSGTEIPSSPYKPSVVDPKAVSFLGPHITGEELARVGKVVKINAKGVHDVADLEVTVESSSGHSEQAKISPASKGSVECSYTPSSAGTDKITAKIAGMLVPGSPFKIRVIDPKLLSVTLRDPQPGEPLLVNSKATIVISAAKGSTEGAVAEMVSSTGSQEISLKLESAGSSIGTITPTEVGKQEIRVTCGGDTVKGSPITLQVCDPSKCRAFGPGLTSGKGKIKEAFEFTVEVKGAGNGELSVIPKGPKSVHVANISKNPEGTYKVSFTTSEIGDHSIEVMWSGKNIPDSPYMVDFYKIAEASIFTATGEGLKTAVAKSAANFIVIGPETGLLSSKVLNISVSGNKVTSTMVSKAEFNPGSRKASVFASDNGNGSYAVEYAVPSAGKFSISVTSDSKHIPGSPFQVNILPAPDAGKCKAFGPAIDSPMSLVVTIPLEFKVDSTEAGTGELSVTAKDPSGETVPVFLAEDKSSAGKKVHSVKIDSKARGKYEVSVMWSDKLIPKSPFRFDVSDPKEVVILDLADSADYIGRKGEAITFSADTRKAGPGELKVAAKLDAGKVETFTQSKNPDGTIKLSYKPTKEGKLELLLTFCGANILPLPWIVDISDPSAFKVIPPKDAGKLNDYVKFTISGMSKKQSKNVEATAKNKAHDATVKLEFGDKGQATARFVAKETGEYTVGVKVAKKHIPGSPFKCPVVNPDGCIIAEDTPTAIPIGTEKQFTVDTSDSGPGELVAECTDSDGNPSNFLFCTVSAGQKKVVKMVGKACGKSSFTLKFAGYAIPSMPVDVIVTDPTSCTFSCKEIEIGFCKTDESITIDIDTTQGGNCPPEVTVKGPKSNYDIELKKAMEGIYTTTLTPWQDGPSTLYITVGGVDIPGSPKNFESLKPLDTNKVTVSGLKEAVANRRAEVTIYARESMLIDRGILSVGFKDEQQYDMEVYDKQNGTYSVTFTPTVTGSLELCVKGNGKDITGSPFNITVVPEPDATKCRIMDRSGDAMFEDSTSVYHLTRTPFELSIFTTGAGTGVFTAAGQAPNGSQIRVFTNDEEVRGERISYIKFDPTFTGVYTLSLYWDKQELRGSPYQIKVVDPKKCFSGDAFPSCVKLGEKVNYEIETKGAGEGVIEVFSKGPEVEATVSEREAGVYVVSITGSSLGSTTVDIKFGGFSLQGAPYALAVCDPTKCTTNFEQGTFNLNMPFKFTIFTEGAGRAKLRVVSTKKGLSVIRNPENSTWEVTFTPKEIGMYSLQVIWGEWEINESPFTFNVCDPSRVRLEGLPNPNDILLLGQPVAFNVDTSEAGAADLVCHTISNGKQEEVVWEETDDDSGVMSLQFTPKNPGKIQIVLRFNQVDVLLKPHTYEVPDPSQFKVTPPKGYGKVKEYVKFSITGVDEETELNITATHPNHDATVKTEKGPDSQTLIARLTPKEIGDYVIEVKVAGQHIDGSPFTAQVCNPDACRFIGDVPSVIHVGVEPDIQIDPSDAGPGELSFESEVISGVQDVATRSEEDKTQWVLSLKEGVGKVRVTALWGGYNIPGSPFILTIVDSKKVTWTCDMLDGRESLTQGDLLKIHVDGSEAGEVVPEVKAAGPGDEYPAKIADNEDGTYTVALNPWQLGMNEVKILWGGQPILDMPILFEVLKIIDAKAITLSGEGLKNAVANTEASIIINAIEEGLVDRGLLEVKFKGEEEEELPTYDVFDEGNGTYKLLFIAPTAGVYTLSIVFEGQPITGSPFDLTVGAAPDAGKCKVFGEAIEKDPPLFIANYPVKFSIDASDAGSGSLSTTAVQPDGEPVRVYAMNEGRLTHLKFDPVLIGHYKMEMKWGDVDLPDSPFDFKVVDPSKCIVEGIPSQGSHVQSEEQIDFSVNMKKVGDCSPKVSVSVRDKVTELVSSDMSNGTLSYSYTPRGFEKTSISVKVAGMHVPKSPFVLSLFDPNTFSITGMNLKGDYAIVCEPVTMEIIGIRTDNGKLVVTAHGPSADLNVETVQKSAELYEASFVPIEPGSYEVFVEYAGKHVNGSPRSIKVADPSRCQLLGKILTSLQVNESGEMTIKTRGAGEGDLKAFVKHEDELYPALECEVKDLGLDTYTVTLTGKEIGKSTIDLRWAGFTIPDSPFLTNVCDASKCKAHGEVLTSKKGKAGSPINFTVETSNAGEGVLEVISKGPSAQYTVSVMETKDSTYEVSFTPWEIGVHKISVFWGKGHVPNSPFIVDVGNPMEMEICNATGDGLKHGIAGQKAHFAIICSEVGLLDKDVLKVSVMGVTAHADVVIKDKNNGCYDVEYIPPIPGAYVASILFHDRQIPGSPFKITVDSGPDASKCRAYGPALHPNALSIAGSPLEFSVDTIQAGYGHLKVYIQGPSDYKPKVFMSNDEKGIYSIKFDAMKAGKYFVVVVWSDKHIPNSPFRIRVHQAADAGKVRVFGPGLLDSFIGTPGQFTIETRNAGIGTLLIRIHGLKDSFRIEAQPLSDGDTRTLIVTYSPKLIGEYTIFIRWSGVHVPGSPFRVDIKQKPGAPDTAIEPVKAQPPPKRKISSPDKKGVQKPERKISAGSRPVIKKSPSGGAIGVNIGLGPSMKLRENPAMAMSLAQSLPPGQQGGYVDPQESAYTGQKIVKRAVKKRVVHKVKRSSSGARSHSREGRSAVPGRAVSPGRGKVVSPSRRGREMSPGTRQIKSFSQPQPTTTTSPAQKQTSPARQASSPSRMATSPARQATSPTRKATSPTRKATSPARKATSPARKATSPTRKATSPSREPASPAKKASSPTRQAASPPRKAASPPRKATSPAPKGGVKKKVVKKGSRAKSPPARKPPTKGKEVPAKKAAKQRF